MKIYMLDSDNDYISYWFDDDELGWQLMGRQTGYVQMPSSEDLPLKMSPSFGDAKDQPTKLGDFHRFMGSCCLFSERAVNLLSLESSGKLFPVKLQGRDEKFYWYWSTNVIDCLDETKTKKLLGLIREPYFHEDRIGDAEVFITPDEEKFQRVLFVTESFKEKVKKAKLKGFVLRKSASDPKPWKS